MKIANIFFNKFEREEIKKETLEKLEELREENNELKKEIHLLRKERIDNLKNIYENEEEIHKYFKTLTSGVEIKMFAIGEKNKLLAICEDREYYTYFEVQNIPNEEYYKFRKKLEEKDV